MKFSKKKEYLMNFLFELTDLPKIIYLSNERFLFFIRINLDF